MASLGWDWSFRAPVLAGDTISVQITVDALRPTKDPSRGIATLSFEVTGQDSGLRQTGTNLLMMHRNR